MNDLDSKEVTTLAIIITRLKNGTVKSGLS